MHRFCYTNLRIPLRVINSKNVAENDFNDYLDTMETLKISTLKLHKIVIRSFIEKVNPKLARCIIWEISSVL